MIKVEEVKVLRKSRTYLEEVVKHDNVIGYIPINQHPTGIKTVRLTDMKVKGLYGVCRGLIDRGKLLRYNANGTLKDDGGGGAVFIDYDEFNRITEF